MPSDAFHGGDRIARYHQDLNGVTARVTYPIVETFGVDHDLAFAVFTSDATTTTGRAYGNFYVVKVSARHGRITHWLEFFDPRPAQMVRSDLAESLAAHRRP
jgi:ketosteroid isomerase-like protein